ncbi:MAG: amidohydrolase [Planctomycetales bacterium]|nr:amidohydrolase [Planctomycetales bacterium]
MVSWQGAIDDLVERHFDHLVHLRRHLHQFPEPSGFETQTSFHLYTLLGDAGIDVQLGPNGCGVIADCICGADSDEDSSLRRIAVRGDIDALRIHDEKDVAYRSQCDGIMHACGHDVHTAIAAGTMLVLHDIPSAAFPAPFAARGILQPAEETCHGASELITDGVIDDVDAIFSVHVDPSLQIGQVGLRRGVLTASCDEFSITIRGTGGHGARPHLAKDPIGAAADLIHAMYLHVPRVTDSQESVVLSIGQISGGHSFNVIPETLTLRGSLRTLSTKVRDISVAHLHRIAQSIGALTETSITIEFGISAPPVDNHRRETEIVRKVATRILGSESIVKIDRPSMGSEDFAFYLQRIPGCMARLGCASTNRGGQGLHTTLFDVDEDAIRIGVRLMANSMIESAMGNID